MSGDYSDAAYRWALEDTSSFAKLIADPVTRRLLAAHIIGPQAATLIQPLIQAIYLDNTVEQLAHDVLYIHPALTEVIVQALLELPDSPTWLAQLVKETGDHVDDQNNHDGTEQV